MIIEFIKNIPLLFYTLFSKLPEFTILLFSIIHLPLSAVFALRIKKNDNQNKSLRFYLLFFSLYFLFYLIALGFESFGVYFNLTGIKISPEYWIGLLYIYFLLNYFWGWFILYRKNKYGFFFHLLAFSPVYICIMVFILVFASAHP